MTEYGDCFAKEARDHFGYVPSASLEEPPPWTGQGKKVSRHDTFLDPKPTYTCTCFRL